MKTLYIQCNMGVAGDMLMSALAEICGVDEFISKIKSLNIPNIDISGCVSEKCGITGTHINVLVGGKSEEDLHSHTHDHNHEHSHTHSHSSMNDIKHIINHLDISNKVKKDAINVYNIIAEAESKVHNKPIDNIHFHEVGTMDAICDIVGVCMLIEEIGADNIIVSPINVGQGQVKCAHGILPVPAPATALILKDVPIYSNNIFGELCTPTGAALVKYFADKFDTMPIMKTTNIGYGMGSKDFEQCNCVRAILGESKDNNDTIVELCCNIDDMTAEELGFACDILRENGALEVFTSSVNMKKNRMGTLLNCICKINDKDKFANLIFKYTSTIGIREYVCNRYVLDREEIEFETEFGNVRAKISSGYGCEKYKIEYDDLEKIAKKNNISISKIKSIIGDVSK